MPACPGVMLLIDCRIRRRERGSLFLGSYTAADCRWNGVDLLIAHACERNLVFGGYEVGNRFFRYLMNMGPN